MKKSFLILVLITFLNDFMILSIPFAKTREEEIKQLVACFHATHQNQSIKSLYEQVLNYGHGLEFVPITQIILPADETDDIDLSEKSILAQDALDTFNALKKMMDIPDEIELWVENVYNSNPAHYNHINRRVEIAPNFFKYPPSVRLFIFIHELTHVQQHQQDGLIIFNKPTPSQAFVYEHQADTAAAQAIGCPVCLQIRNDDFFLSENFHNKKLVNFFHQMNESIKGYLTTRELEQYIVTKNNNDLCHAHAVDN